MSEEESGPEWKEKELEEPEKPETQPAPPKPSVVQGQPVWFRRKFLVNPKIQIGYAIAVAWLVLVAISLTAMTVYYSLTSVVLEPASRLNMVEAIDFAHRMIFWRLLLIAVVLVVGGMVATVYLLHRIVGPMIRMENVLKAAAAGFLPESIQLRKNDEFKTVAAALYQMLESYETETPVAVVEQVKQVEPEAEGVE